MLGTARARPRWTILLLFALVTALAGGPLVAEPMRVSSGSMSPLYEPGDEVLVVKVGPRSREPRRNDVIVLRAGTAEELMIKRVVALGGDRVSIADGVLVVNSRRVAEPYVDHAQVDGTHFGPVRIPRGAVWVLGDARAGSVDSRAFGAVPSDAIVGLVVAQAW